VWGTGVRGGELMAYNDRAVGGHVGVGDVLMIPPEGTYSADQQSEMELQTRQLMTRQRRLADNRRAEKINAAARIVQEKEEVEAILAAWTIPPDTCANCHVTTPEGQRSLDEYNRFWDDDGDGLSDRGLYAISDAPEELGFVESMSLAWEHGDASQRTVIVATGVGTAGGFIPYFGDWISLGGSTVVLVAEPSWEHLGDAGWDTLGAIVPGMPAVGSLRRIERLGDAANLLHDAERLADTAADSQRLMEASTSVERLDDVGDVGRFAEDATHIPDAPDVTFDVPTGALFRDRVTAGQTSRGITDAMRDTARDRASRYGTMDGNGLPYSGPVDVGHDFGNSHVFTLPGEQARVGVQTRFGNQSQAAAERAAARMRREWNAANPNGPQLPVRPLP
jgi:hypothetical protein